MKEDLDRWMHGELRPIDSIKSMKKKHWFSWLELMSVGR